MGQRSLVVWSAPQPPLLQKKASGFGISILNFKWFYLLNTFVCSLTLFGNSLSLWETVVVDSSSYSQTVAIIPFASSAQCQHSQGLESLDSRLTRRHASGIPGSDQHLEWHNKLFSVSASVPIIAKCIISQKRPAEYIYKISKTAWLIDDHSTPNPCEAAPCPVSHSSTTSPLEHWKNTFAFHYTAWFVGILQLVY